MQSYKKYPLRASTRPDDRRMYSMPQTSNYETCSSKQNIFRQRKNLINSSKVVRRIMKDEQLHDWLGKQKIAWQFNLSRAPWWGGQFERMVGLVKQALYKTTGKASLSWHELEEVLLDIEITLNHRPLSYIEDDLQLPILTPHTQTVGRPNLIPETENVDLSDADTDQRLRKRANYIRRCKDAWWSRWSSEYLKALRTT